MELFRLMELVLPDPKEATVVKKLALLILAAVAIFATAGGASAQVYYFGPGYGAQIEPRYDRGYRDDRDHDRRYRRGDYRSSWNGCPRNYTVQDGVCKPYRGY